jgi:hypothetical protein
VPLPSSVDVLLKMPLKWDSEEHLSTLSSASLGSSDNLENSEQFSYF